MTSRFTPAGSELMPHQGQLVAAALYASFGMASYLIAAALFILSLKWLSHPRTARRGVLAVNGDDGYPYAVPINYFYDEAQEKIYFHSARAGHKVDSLTACDKVCFTVYGNESIREEAWAPFAGRFADLVRSRATAGAGTA